MPALSDVVCVDVAQPADVDAAFQRSVAALGGLDTMVCTAGISIRRGFLDIGRWIICCGEIGDQALASSPRGSDATAQTPTCGLR